MRIWQHFILAPSLALMVIAAPVAGAASSGRAHTPDLCADDIFTGVFKDNGAAITTIDPADGSSTLTGVLAGISGVTALARDGDLLYLATGDADDSLYVTDLGTGMTAKVGPFGGGATNIQAMDLATEASALYGFEPGVLYGVSIDGSGPCFPNCFFRIDPKTGAATEIAALALEQGRGASFHPETGELWILDSNTKRLHTVDAFGHLHFKAQMPEANQGQETGLSTAYNLAHGIDGTLYAVDAPFGVLVKLDPVAGTAVWVGKYGSVRDHGGSFQLHGLDSPCRGGGAPCPPVAERPTRNGTEAPEGILVARGETRVTVTTLRGESSASNNKIELPGGATYFVQDEAEGTRFPLGSFAADEELILMLSNALGQVFLSGPADNNPDHFVHWNVTRVAPGIFVIGWEDIFGGGDRDYDDAYLQICGDLQIRRPPNPPGQGRCTQKPLGMAGSFSVFTRGDFTASSSDVEGAVAVGGDATLTSYSIGTGLPPGFGGDSLIVGGNLTFTWGQVAQGNAVWGGTGSLTGVGFAPGRSGRQGTPFNFAAEAAHLSNASRFWAALEETAPADVKVFGGSALITMSGTDPELNVFTIDASVVNQAVFWEIEAPAGSTVLVNVLGTTVDLSGFDFLLSGGVSSDLVLFNFPDATTVDIRQIAIDGAVLALEADINVNNSQVNGRIIGASFLGNGQPHEVSFNGCLPLP